MAIRLSKLNGLTEKLKCESCKKWLHTFPIYYHPSKGNICGRCRQTLTNIDDYTRSQNLEAILEHFSYPCSNQAFGCKVDLKFEEVENHEKYCQYKPIHCPKCLNWEGSFVQLDSHISDKHNELLLNPAIIDFELIKNGINTFFTQTDDKMFTLLIENVESSQKIYFSVMLNRYIFEELYRYEFHFYTDENNDIVSLPMQSVDSYFDLSMSRLEHGKMLPIDVPFLKYVFNNTTLIKFKITIGQEYILKQNKQLITSASCIYSELQCLVCFECMIPPIKMCKEGHSVCGNCSSKINNCPLCRSYSNNDTCRNFALEKIITSYVKLRCENKNLGCTFSEKYENVLLHQKKCGYASASCANIELGNCKWKGLFCNIVEHIKTMHVPNETSTIFTLKGEPSQDRHLIIEHNEIFMFLIITEKSDTGSTGKFLMQHLTMREQITYCYKVTFTISGLKNTGNVTFEGCCQKYQKSPSNYNSLSEYLMKQFAVKYSLKIFRI